MTFTDASLTFNSFPLRGKTPKLSRPTIPNPAIAKAFAESPSVRIREQLDASLPPALLASSSLGIPFSLISFFPSVFLRPADSLNSANLITLSTIPDLASFFIILTFGL